jgi:hypothetical protein
MNLFLAELGQAVAPGAHGIVLMDEAGWHTSGDLVVPENLGLVFLPPYSPELNPIERLWLHLGENIGSFAPAWASFKAFTRRSRRGCNRWSGKPASFMDAENLRTPSHIRRDSEVTPPSFAQIGLPILEPLGAQLRVPHRVLYRAVAEPELQRSRVFAAVGVVIPAGVPEHVHVHWKVKTRFLPSTPDHLRETGSRERRTALRHEHLPTVGPVSAQLPQRPDFITVERVRRWHTILLPAYVDQSVRRRRSTWSHRSSHNSETRKPWRAAIRIASASRCP